jgi:hypothetical protein
MSKYAPLTAGILARKGEAEPSATPFADQLLTRVGAPSPDLIGLTPMHGHVHLHMEPGYQKPQGLRPPKPKPLDPVATVFGKYGRKSPPELVRFEAQPATAEAHDDEETGDSHCVVCPGPSPEEAGKTFHVNLRLKRMRFVKLKLSSALLRRPVQEIVAEALDDWFERLPKDVMGDCACLKTRCE